MAATLRFTTIGVALACLAVTLSVARGADEVRKPNENLRRLYPHNQTSSGVERDVVLTVRLGAFIQPTPVSLSPGEPLQFMATVAKVGDAAADWKLGERDAIALRAELTRTGDDASATDARRWTWTWGQSTTVYEAHELAAWRQSLDPLQPGSYSLEFTLEATGDRPALRTHPVEVIVAEATLEDALRSHREQLAGQPASRVTLAIAHDGNGVAMRDPLYGHVLAVLENRSDRPVKVSAYVEGRDNETTPPLSVLNEVERFRAVTGWQSQSLGWCGTGVGQHTVEPGRHVRLHLTVPGEGVHRFRVHGTTVDNAPLHVVSEPALVKNLTFEPAAK